MDPYLELVHVRILNRGSIPREHVGSFFGRLSAPHRIPDYRSPPAEGTQQKQSGGSEFPIFQVSGFHPLGLQVHK